MVKGKGYKRPNNKTETQQNKKQRAPESTISDSELTASQESVSLSDSDFAYPSDEDLTPQDGRIILSLSDLESSKNSATKSQDPNKSSDSEEADESSSKPFNEDSYRQQLSVLRCRYNAELERIEDEICTAENSYFGTRRTRFGCILKGYGDYASCNLEIARNRKYCRPVKLVERVFSLSSRTSKVRKDYEEECKKEAMRRDAQLAAGYGYIPTGMDPQGFDGGLGAMPHRLSMECYPNTCQGASFAYNLGGKLHQQHLENPAFGQQLPPYLYAPQTPNHMFLSYDNRHQLPLQGPQMMGPSMRIETSQPFLTHLEPGGDGVEASALRQPTFLQEKQSETKRDGSAIVKEDEELVGGDSFNVEQYLNEAPNNTNNVSKTENGN